MPKNYNLYLKGYVGDWNFSADMVNAVLDKHKDKEVCVLIDSTGGRVDTALSISSLFKLHGNVHCHYVGMNASAATIASMGAKHVSIDANALFLVHKCMSVVFEWDYMNADELAAHIADLEKLKKDNETIDGCIAGMYASRCKKPKEDLLALMKEGAWLTARQALEWGFVDEITDDPEDAAPEFTDVVADALAKEGIPMPPVAVKKGSFLERLAQLFSSSHSKPAAEANVPEAAQSTPQMSKALTAVAALVGATVAVTDGKLTLTEDQADKLEAAVAAHDATVNDLNSKITEKVNKINELNAKIADLVKEPASDTADVTETSKETNPLNSLDIDKVCDAILSNF
ncbi:MAG: ATP-dependent Clp protease proteolytic subunit [Muribaculaceae bacterium]|nr:ATP-dependent Clp protease proteolytic subunit [Muribaculaceae bacterium]